LSFSLSFIFPYRPFPKSSATPSRTPHQLWSPVLEAMKSMISKNLEASRNLSTIKKARKVCGFSFPRSRSRYLSERERRDLNIRSLTQHASLSHAEMVAPCHADPHVKEKRERFGQVDLFSSFPWSLVSKQSPYATTECTLSKQPGSSHSCVFVWKMPE